MLKFMIVSWLLGIGRLLGGKEARTSAHSWQRPRRRWQALTFVGMNFVGLLLLEEDC
jgi:hypothetical protein